MTTNGMVLVSLSTVIVEINAQLLIKSINRYD